MTKARVLSVYPTRTQMQRSGGQDLTAVVYILDDRNGAQGNENRQQSLSNARHRSFNLVMQKNPAERKQ